MHKVSFFYRLRIHIRRYFKGHLKIPPKGHAHASCDTPYMWLVVLVVVPQKGSRAKRLLVPPNSAYQQCLPMSLVHRFVEDCHTLCAFASFSKKDAEWFRSRLRYYVLRTLYMSYSEKATKAMAPLLFLFSGKFDCRRMVFINHNLSRF